MYYMASMHGSRKFTKTLVTNPEHQRVPKMKNNIETYYVQYPNNATARVTVDYPPVLVAAIPSALLPHWCVRINTSLSNAMDAPKLRT